MNHDSAPAIRQRATYTGDSALPEVTDDMLRDSVAQMQPYTVVILKAGPGYQPPGPKRTAEVARIIWEHGKRNARLRAAGLKPIICPIADGSEYAGFSVMTVTTEEADRILSLDPAVLAGVLSYETHPTRSFPDSTLPE